MPGVMNLSTGSDGQVINMTEKPVPLARKLIAHYTNMNSRVLVVGSGSGSACIAALHANKSVMAVESDHMQWYESCARIVKFSEGMRRGQALGGDLAFITSVADANKFIRENRESQAKKKKRRRTDLRRRITADFEPNLRTKTCHLNFLSLLLAVRLRSCALTSKPATSLIVLTVG